MVGMPIIVAQAAWAARKQAPPLRRRNGGFGRDDKEQLSVGGCWLSEKADPPRTGVREG